MDLCRKQGLTPRNRSILVGFPRQISSHFFGACEDPWDNLSTIGCLVLVEDPFDLAKCQEQFPKFSFWGTPESNN